MWTNKALINFVDGRLHIQFFTQFIDHLLISLSVYLFFNKLWPNGLCLWDLNPVLNFTLKVVTLTSNRSKRILFPVMDYIANRYGCDNYSWAVFIRTGTCLVLLPCSISRLVLSNPPLFSHKEAAWTMEGQQLW